ncbi:MAG: hypothetical protein WC384_22580 [Prolixibacteraceae bacterium]|jgi:hypothetical protein
MKESDSFSRNEIEPASLNFSELREKGLEYVQELCGEVWTDYNSHDPGVTILEQLCYALTDVAFRTSLPVEDLLTPAKGLPLIAQNNAFFSPSTIFSSHPVTAIDVRKMIIDRFEEIQNAWIFTNENSGYQEELNGINRIEILPKLNFLNAIKTDSNKKSNFLADVNQFLANNRNLGEKFADVCLLEPQPIELDFDIYINESFDTEETLANVFLKLFEFVYSPVQHYSFSEMTESYLSMAEIFSGPLLTKGFLKDNIPGKRLKYIQVDELQKLFSKVKGVDKCDVRNIIYNGIAYKLLNAEPGKFLHLLDDKTNGKMMDKRFESLYSSMNEFLNYKKIPAINKQIINNLFFEIWSKKHRGYSLGQQDDFFRNKLNGVFRNPGEYHSIQRHFPLIYKIGLESVLHEEPVEKEHIEPRAKAMQLKGYLMLFEQHMANHLAQLSNLNEFFNINFDNRKTTSYFSQKMTSVPEVEKLVKKNADLSLSEPDRVFFDRKNRTYNHLLARFGEDLNELPWRVARRLNLVKTEDEFNRILLNQKSEFLQQLEKLSYSRMKGEAFRIGQTHKNSREPSGLEQIILMKTGIPQRTNQSLIPDLHALKTHTFNYREEDYKSGKELNEKYRPLRTGEIIKFAQVRIAEIPNVFFGKIGLKTLFRETLNFKNYRLSISQNPEKDKVKVIFQKEPNVWVGLFESTGEGEAVRNISELIDFFIEKNLKSEGIYIVDHILLSDFLEGSTFGFCFLDEIGNTLFQTFEDKSWCATEVDRANCLAKFYELGQNSGNYKSENGKWNLKDAEGNTLATYQPASQSLLSPEDELQELCNQTQNLIRLFSGTDEMNGRLRFEEMEKIRLGGVANVKGQRQLIFRRKLKSSEIIDEDFFNLKISVVLPDWPARFQEDQFKDYLTNLIYERTPAHIRTEIIWVNVNEMKVFEEKYTAWENVKLNLENSYTSTESLKKAAFEVYQSLKELNNKPVK